MNKRKIILDTDPGIDDAAIAAAVKCESIEVMLITTVAGNVSVEQTTKNTLKLLEFYEKEIPVAKGVSRPLIKEPENASDIHGETGLGGTILVS